MKLTGKTNNKATNLKKKKKKGGPLLTHLTNEPKKNGYQKCAPSNIPKQSRSRFIALRCLNEPAISRISIKDKGFIPTSNGGSKLDKGP